MSETKISLEKEKQKLVEKTCEHLRRLLGKSKGKGLAFENEGLLWFIRQGCRETLLKVKPELVKFGEGE